MEIILNYQYKMWNSVLKKSIKKQIVVTKEVSYYNANKNNEIKVNWSLFDL